jgi:hypothetical protein
MSRTSKFCLSRSNIKRKDNFLVSRLPSLLPMGWPSNPKRETSRWQQRSQIILIPRNFSSRQIRSFIQPKLIEKKAKGGPISGDASQIQKKRDSSKRTELFSGFSSPSLTISRPSLLADPSLPKDRPRPKLSALTSFQKF